MKRHLWYKLATNCVINPLTAIYQCTNGSLEHVVPDLSSRMDSILEELCLVHNTQAYHLQYHVANSNHNNIPHTSLPSQQDPSTILSKEELKAFVYQVLHDTHDNKSSMLQDILQQKRTEIQELNGYVVRIGQRYGLECPIHQELVERIQKLEANSQDDNDNDNDTPNNNRNPNQGSSIGWEE